jgi:hypothetical protein
MNIEDFTEEGKRLYRALSKYQTITEPPKPPVKPPGFDLYQFNLDILQKEVLFLKKEMARMIKNSELVIADCDIILEKVKTKEEYIKSDAKVAKTLHQNNIERLIRVLDGRPAFDYEVKLDDED